MILSTTFVPGKSVEDMEITFAPMGKLQMTEVLCLRGASSLLRDEVPGINVVDTTEVNANTFMHEFRSCIEVNACTHRRAVLEFEIAVSIELSKRYTICACVTRSAG